MHPKGTSFGAPPVNFSHALISTKIPHFWTDTPHEIAGNLTVQTINDAACLSFSSLDAFDGGNGGHFGGDHLGLGAAHPHTAETADG